MSGKGDKRRPVQIDKFEEDLRWELAFKCKDNPERKAEILEMLKEIKDMRKWRANFRKGLDKRPK